MKSIFKTGTFLTAENLNLAQKVIGISSGVYEGCTVSVSSWDKSVLSVAPGIAKLSDGTIVKFDGSETINISALANDTTYYVCVVKYSDYSIALEIVQTLPSYTFIKIANVTKKDLNNVEIVNSYVIKEDEIKLFINTDYLQKYFESNRREKEKSPYYNLCDVATDYSEDYDIEYLKVTSKNVVTTFQEEARAYFAFLANSSISKITLCGFLSGVNSMVVYVYVNNERVVYVPNLTESNFNKTSDVVIEIPSDTISNRDAVVIQFVAATNERGSKAEFNLHQIIIN